MPAATAPVRFRLCFVGGFAERHSRAFAASGHQELFERVREHYPEVGADGLRGRLTLQAECRFLHQGREEVEWRSVGPDALPIDGDAFLHAMLCYKARCFREASALASAAPEGASG